MIKSVLLAVWIAAVSLGSAYGVLKMQTAKKSEEKHEDGLLSKVEYVKPNEISVPMIIDGRVTGYVIARFVFAINSEALNKGSVPPDFFLIDEAFKIIYEGQIIDFKSIKKQDLPQVAINIKKSINKRMEAELVKDVLIQELKYIPSDGVR
ncbi:MAG: hypothetical protein KTR19_13280 [Hyphomicrobiales bacterium]|nr:hypothetical protein [Hyphomicrobiales bacterium]